MTCPDRAVAGDAEARAHALDAGRSFIVQAPAGSGKTGLLIQRYLRLLACVSRPEEVLAITFTRKAAAEMRRRVLQAFASARGPCPELPDAALTWQLARDALAQDERSRWALRENPARLRIQTIDSLSASLARQMPVVSQLGNTPAIVEDARELYRAAAERTLAQLAGGPAANAVATLLEHMDGDWAELRGLLELMLARRDQWLPRVAGFHADAHAREELERAFRDERSRIMARALRLMPPHEEAELAQLARFAAASAPGLAGLAAMTAYPAADETGAPQWQALVALLLTADTQFRKQVNKNQGFPGGGAHEAELKRRMGELLARLCEVDGLCEALEAIRCMPPARFSDSQWQVLGAVVAILPRADEELRRVFSERGEIDFTGISRAAVQSLGGEGEPTDLLLALDVRLRHLLVDEFQDTSHSQWELFARLTDGWEPGDGRTVFLVGDPMQSIYRFREADVSLFLRARSEGLPQVRLEDLRLATNFRSQAGIVDWVNRHFASILPAHEDADAGAVPYASARAYHPDLAGEAVTWHPFLGTDPAIARDAEAARVVEVVSAALHEAPDDDVAILVRNRAHLDRILPALQKAQIRFRAVDIEPLEGRQVIQDLLAITRALVHLADRVAWLGLLRAPWCALTLHDLHALTGGLLAREGAKATTWELFRDEARLSQLSAAGRERLHRVREVLAPYVAGRLRGSLRERVEGAWTALGGPACLQARSDLEDAETFFDQLDRLEHAGDLADIAVLEQQLERLYAAPDTGEAARVQLMTIHKAKGLQFGTVVVPGLDRIPRVSDRPLCLWKVRAAGAMMLAPIRPANRREEPAYDYLRRLENASAQHELERLLYVAVTRAESRIHLLGYARLQEKQGALSLRTPPSTTLLGKAWPAARAPFEAAIERFRDAVGRRAQPPVLETKLRRLDLACLAVAVPAPNVPRRELAADARDGIEFSWVGETARHVGTLTHAWLQRIAADGITAWDDARVGGVAVRVESQLLERGVPAAEIGAATRRVLDALRTAINDERGRWILAARPDARNEHRIRVATPEGVQLLVIDRLFTEAGRRWVVDYKTSSHEGGELEAFLDREKARYGGRMARYVPAFEGMPGTLALYFPAVAGWRAWEPEDA